MVWDICEEVYILKDLGVACRGQHPVSQKSSLISVSPTTGKKQQQPVMPALYLVVNMRLSGENWVIWNENKRT